MSKVFIPQLVKKLHPSGVLAPAYDISRAIQFGEFVHVLTAADRATDLGNCMGRIKGIMSKFGQDDYLMAIGDPTLIAACAGIVIGKFNRIQMLRWDRRYNNYSKVEVKL